jgi:hypothetical protein
MASQRLNGLNIIEAHYLHSRKHPPAFADRYEATMDLWRLWKEGKLAESDCSSPRIPPFHKPKEPGRRKEQQYDHKLRQNVLSEWGGRVI